MKVFISHSSVDKEFVRTLKKDLNANGVLTWFDEDQLDLGDSLLEKLDSGLTESTHFIIVLSQASTNSDWVKYEVRKALENKSLNLINKVIPLKYNDCDVPNELTNILYGDLSNETRIIKGDYVEFYSPEYIKVVDKICRSIKKSEKQLTKQEIEDIKGAINKSEKELEKKNSKEVIKGLYKINGYTDKVARLIYANRGMNSGKNNVESIKPILLPPLWQTSLPTLKLGDTISISKNYFYTAEGHFAGFRKDDTSITVDGRIRQILNLQKGKTYKVEFNLIEKRLNFITS
jgi:hypothetical protein